MPRARLLLVVLAAAAGAPAQIIFNEAHALPTGNGPTRLIGDYVELWNLSPVPIDLTGYVLALWNTDTQAPVFKVIPAGPASPWIPGNGFYVLEEGGVLGQPLCDANLAQLPGMMMGTSPWGSNGNLGAYLRTPGGVCVDYMYLRRGTTALPAAPPNLPAGCAWTLGNIAASGTGFDHLKRDTNTPTGSYLDWSQDATINIGTPGAPNTAPAPAAQTPIGPYVAPANIGYCRFGQPNTPAATLNINGIAGPAFPANRILYSTETLNLSVSGAPNSPVFLALSPACNVGHLPVGGQIFDLGAPAALFADVFLVNVAGVVPILAGPFLPFAATDALGNLVLSLPLGGAVIPKSWVQVLIADASPAGLSISGATALEVRAGVGGCGPGAVIPDGLAGGGNGVPVVLTFTTPPGATILDVNLIVDISHSWMGDIDFTLSFNGASVLLTNGTPDSANDFSGEYRFSDEGTTTMDAAASAASLCIPPGTYIGDVPLTIFDGMDTGAGGGVWTLTVVDTFINDIGRLNSWCIEINTSL